MPPLALVLALSAAVLHAGWNLVVKRSGDRLVSAAAISGGAAVVTLPIPLLAGLPDRRVWGLIALSAVLETVYMVLLATAYEKGDLSFIYPIARGTAPVLVTAAGIIVLEDRVTPLGIAGVAVLTAALAVLARRGARREGLTWALATGAVIAAYTTIDAAAARSDGSALKVVAAVFLLHAPLLAATVGVLRGREALARFGRAEWARSLAGGVGSAGAYGLALGATLLAPVGLVSGVRETSVVFGVVAGRSLLGEAVDRRHLLAVLAATAGIVMVGLS
jgi:drug/metabolite transporter (DMT)-like permease